jgi:RNA polymerase sigma-70 factor (ECF subfamily)
MDDDFERFYTASYTRLLWELFAATGGDLHEAEDALQEAYARAALRWRRIRAYDRPAAWVRRVALNLAASAARRTRRRAAVLLRLTPPAPPATATSELSADSLDLTAALRTLGAGHRGGGPAGL